MINLDILEAIKYLLLGIIQGITEVLPISSSGHVEIAQAIFHVQKDEGLLFLILVNTGSLLTFLIIYWKRLVELLKDFLIYIFKKESRETTKANFIYALMIVVACIPAGITGLILGDTIDNIVLAKYGTFFVGIGFLLSGTVLYLIREVRIKRGKTMINWADVLIIGLAQAVAVFPGVSRSGMTSSTSIKRGMGIDSALNFSFLMYIPLSFASILLYISDLSSEGLGLIGSEYIFYYILAFIGAAGATYFAYKLIFNIFKSGKLKYFSFYLFILGLGSMFYFMIK
ncbi:MAG: undecaprenyl-diphosphate phosphatase [Tenericutes bacterium]|nr:undecaprenyl-diphosphate phosphatase [Mycoplasmatota bacterium]